MQVIYKYRILIGIGIIIGHTFLISLALKAREGIRQSTQISNDKVYPEVETERSNKFRENESDSLINIKSGIISEGRVALEDKIFSIDL